MRTVVSGLHKLEEHVSRIAAFVIDELGSGELLLVIQKFPSERS